MEVDGNLPQMDWACRRFASHETEDFFMFSPSFKLQCIALHSIAFCELRVKPFALKAAVSKTMIESARMNKDAQLTFRVQTDLKRELETIAASEGRSVAQICEAFLKASCQNYKKKGTKLLTRFLAQRRSRQKDI